MRTGLFEYVNMDTFEDFAYEICSVSHANTENGDKAHKSKNHEAV